MTTVSDIDLAGLARFKSAGKIPAKALLHRLSAISYITVTPRGELRVTGLGNDALTLYRHGIQSMIKLPQDEDKSDESAPEDAETFEPTHGSSASG